MIYPKFEKNHFWRVSFPRMHILQPKHIKLKQNEVEELLKKYNISISQLPKIKSTDPCVPEGCKQGDILKIEREEEGKISVYFRVIV